MIILRYNYILFNDKINHFLFPLALLSIIFFYFTEQGLFTLITIISGLIILFRYLLVKSKETFYIIIGLFVLFLFFLIKSMYYGNLGLLRTILMIYAQVGLAFYFFYGKYRTRIISITFYTVTMYFIFRILTGVKAEDILIYSENIVNFIAIVLGISLYIIKYIESNHIPLHPAIIVFIVSILTMGRSGIIVSIFLLISVIYFKYGWRFKFIVTILLVTLLFSEKMVNSILIFFENILSRFGTRVNLTENVRYDIWQEYIDSINLSNFIFGYDAAKIHFFYGFSNLHNSFLSGHYFLGILMPLILLIILFILFILILNKDLFFAFLFISLLLRAFSDKVLFAERFDFVYIFFILYVISLLKEKNNNAIKETLIQRSIINH